MLFCVIVYIAPEALNPPLKGALENFANNGVLTLVVVDEAHTLPCGHSGVLPFVFHDYWLSCSAFCSSYLRVSMFQDSTVLKRIPIFVVLTEGGMNTFLDCTSTSFASLWYFYYSNFARYCKSIQDANTRVTDIL